MMRPRLIVLLLLKHGIIVRSQQFKVHQDIGNPMSSVERFSQWNIDELIVLDIGKEDFHDLRRDDLQQRYLGNTTLDVLREIASVCYMPLAFGGRIRNLQDIANRLEAGADKCIINTHAIEQPDFITASARKFGSQCIVVSIDAKRRSDGSYEVYVDGGQRPTGKDVSAWAYEAQELGAGEIFLNSIDQDGSGEGYDLTLINTVTDAVDIPVIACGGVGKYQHFADGVLNSGAAAVAAANLYHFFELSYPLAKQICIDAGIAMRPVGLGSKWFPREPVYNQTRENRRIAQRLQQAEKQAYPAAQREPNEPNRNFQYCTTCVYPSTSAAPIEFDNNGVCTGCLEADKKNDMSAAEWTRRRELLRDILEQYRCRDGTRHDCIIPVSGGKDSYFQTHVIKNEFGLNPLLVTYNANNYTPTGWRNLHHMKEAFGVDHIICGPSVKTLKKLNRLGFIIMGDMNWHGHVGIFSLPVRMAVQTKIPLLIWGEHGYLDLCGQFSMNDFPEMTYRDRLEHFARGYEWNYFVGREELTSQDLIWYQYPTDRELFENRIRGIHLGNYIHWEANEHGQMVAERYGFKISPEPFDRTYRRMSNLDDMHENGVHDYMKYIKFGYGRCTDHVCKDIRAGRMDRKRGIELVRKHDPVKPRDLTRWLEYTGMTETEFDRIADTFRDPRVWWMEDNKWLKKNLWDNDAAENNNTDNTNNIGDDSLDIALLAQQQ